MANAVFTTKVNPSYDDLPELRYHFPKSYLNQASQTIGDWILYYEPRREDANLSGRAGRMAYFATARVDQIVEDPTQNDHFYANVTDYLEFTHPVPFKSGQHYFESALRKTDGSTNKGAFGRAVRTIPLSEFEVICRAGLSDVTLGTFESSIQMAEDPVQYGRSTLKQFVERPFRDRAFTEVIQTAYHDTCAMTGLRLINGGGRCEIEAAHIKPVAARGPDSPRNGIALSRTIHWMFDRGILSASDDGEILIAKRLAPNPVLRLLNPDRRILRPDDPLLIPHQAFLRYHRENVFKG
jgi:putative restriction endonuclease